MMKNMARFRNVLTYFLVFLLLVSCSSPARTVESATPFATNTEAAPTGIPTQIVAAKTADFHSPPNITPENLVIYEVNIRAFSSSGDLTGVIDRLDEIKALGVNVIWLMPIFPIGKVKSVNSPYSVQNYKELNPEFGDMEDLKTLVHEARCREMAVILDWVANHTAWDNPWIQNIDWYTQQNGQIIHPAGTNWQDVADLNYDNQEMRQAMIQAMIYWVEEADIDGYRFDAADMVPFDFWVQALAALNAIPNRDLILLAEGERADHYQAGFQITFSWAFYNAIKNVFNGQPATRLYATHVAEYKNLADGWQKLRFITNHDESAWDATPVTLFNGQDGSLAAFLIATYMGGVPLIYSSQEVGVVQPVPFFSSVPIDWNQNPEMLRAYKNMMVVYTNSDALRMGGITDCSTKDIVCFLKAIDDEEVLVLVNVRQNTATFNLPDEYRYTNWVNTFSDAPVMLGMSQDLAGYAFLVLQRQNNVSLP
jgi:1,4-alpha-glucan branching enzyme